MPFPRSSGILLHPTSFPGRYGMGDLGAAAREFVDFLQDSGQHLWQILPLGPTGYGNSPYMSYSAIAGNPLLISLDSLLEQNLLNDADLLNIPDFDPDFVEFEQVTAWKWPLLHRAAKRFKTTKPSELRPDFDKFCLEKAHWLEDYALFMSLLEANGYLSWNEWPAEIRDRQPDAMAQSRLKLAEPIFHHKFLQFEFFRQWQNLKAYANDHQVQIFGDIPIYVSFNSVDVWANSQLFQLTPEKDPIVVAGVPPDYFSVTGQRWGNPLYDWDVMERNGFEWWTFRIRACLEMVDMLRIDHFRGLEAYWAIPATEETAVNGEWVPGPSAKLFEALDDALGTLPIIAEDLGDIDQAVLDLRDQFAFPGMKILHFAFGDTADNPYLPFNVTPNSVIYTGTHDNDTTIGWYENASDYVKQRFHDYLGCTGPDGIAWDMIRLAYSSVANQAIVPLQDVLNLGSNARMNLPGTVTDNWRWRYRHESLTPEYRDRLKHMALTYGRYRPDAFNP